MAEDPGTTPQVRLAFRIGYLGSSFSGSQYQPDKRTVEGEIESACIRAGIIRDRKESRLALSGRTDRGVHARCQILAFSTASPDRAVRALNGQLPPDIWVTSYSQVLPEFYPRYDVISRTYRFYYAKMPQNIGGMREAASLLLGEHDFSCFARVEPGKNPVKIVDRLDLYTGDGWCWLEITAGSFLWHMVRCIAAALLGISEGTLSMDTLLEYLKGTCTNKIKPAPPDGLILWDVATDISWQEIPMPGLKTRKLAEKAEYHHLLGRVYSLLLSS